MTLNDYQQKALLTAKDQGNEFFHRVLGLVGEAGEIAEKVKKLVRDHNSDLAKLDKDDIAKELGDTLWYIAALADYLGYSLEEIGQRNIDKMSDRQKRGLINGTGDNR